MDKQRYAFFFIIFAVILLAAVVLRVRQAGAPVQPPRASPVVVSAVATSTVETSPQPSPERRGGEAMPSPQRRGEGEVEKEVQPRTWPVTITSHGFEPRSLIIRVGDHVEWRNTTTRRHWIASDPHPAHTNHSEFDRIVVNPGAKNQYTFGMAGVFNYHDHLSPSLRGDIVVK